MRQRRRIHRSLLVAVLASLTLVHLGAGARLAAASDRTPVVPVGDRAAGSRLLMVGDSISLALTERYGGEACKALVPFGWRIEIDAAKGEFVDFGEEVLDARLEAGWDAAILFLGTNYRFDQRAYAEQLHDLLARLAPRPTVVITTSVFRPQQREVNDAIRFEAAAFPNVSVIDWARVTADDRSLTGRDRIHLTEAGKASLAYQLAAALGHAPRAAGAGACLPNRFA